MDYEAQYGELHAKKGGKYFGGRVRGVRDVARLVILCEPANMLDYGSGKGRQYTERKIQNKWGGTPVPTCYDVGVPELRRRPAGKFDGVICCDMLEHIEEHDVDGVLADIFGYANYPRKQGQSFVYLTISTRPAVAKKLPDGRNVHLTVRPESWWRDKIKKFEHPDLVVVVLFDIDEED